EPVFTFTVQELPLPETPAMLAPETPLVSREKSLESTPVTLSLNVTVKATLVALVGLASARLSDCTTGVVVSWVIVGTIVALDSDLFDFWAVTRKVLATPRFRLTLMEKLPPWGVSEATRFAADTLSR